MESESKKEPTPLTVELAKIFESLEKVRTGQTGPETPVTVRQGDHFSVVIGSTVDSSKNS
jgi:hypothetical protein